MYITSYHRHTLTRIRFFTGCDDIVFHVMATALEVTFVAMTASAGSETRSRRGGEDTAATARLVA